MGRAVDCRGRFADWWGWDCSGSASEEAVSERSIVLQSQRAERRVREKTGPLFGHCGLTNERQMTKSLVGGYLSDLCGSSTDER